jgi:hypothetical protein
VYHRALETHGARRELTPQRLEVLLKLYALLYRGVVVTDSDLNNNRALHAVSKRDGPFADALRSGFVVRAARTASDGQIQSPLDVLENLRRRSRARADLVPRDHVVQLDNVFERDGAGTVTWCDLDIAGIFHTRLRYALRREAARQWGGAGAMAERVLAFLDAEPTAGAADLERRFAREAGSSPAWQRVWELVLGTYGGNVPYAFGGRLIVGEPHDGIVGALLPAGPGTPVDAVADQVEHYASALSDGPAEVRLEVGAYERGGPPRFRLDVRRLLELRIPELAELREAAEPAAFFDLRHRALDSPTAVDVREELLAAAVGYLERLADRGRTLWEVTPDTALRRQRVETYREYARRRRREDERGLLLSMVSLVASPVLGFFVSLGEMIPKAWRLDRQRWEADHDVVPPEFEDLLALAQRRPDYRVIEAMRG